jgi:dynamin GTPase
MSEVKGTQSLISVINDLQNVFASNLNSIGIELPQIAVVGGQSAGKSSVLENFVGKDFLPRGQGIVTRRPLVIQMHHNEGREWAEFLHTGDRKFHDFTKVRQEIEEETDREVGKNKSISNKPINMRIYSPHVFDLTLIDLPGLTKVPTGDQPEDIEYQIRHMIYDYIQQENTIILAVTPANQDLANSDALKLARHVDPSGKRTIGVITKLDLMDDGTNALNIFEGKLCPLRKGYIGIVNRSQKEIDGNKKIEDALKKEQEFFLNSPYKHLMQKMGSQYLQNYLSKELMSHIGNTFPQLLSSLEGKLEEISDELRALGFSTFGGGNKINFLYKLIGLFIRDVVATLEGNAVDVSSSSPKAGYEINQTLYGGTNDLLHAVESEPIDEIIAFALANLGGYQGNIFPHQLAFDITVRKTIEKYKKPIKDVVGIIRNIMIACVEECAENRFKSYPKLKTIALGLVKQIIEKNMGVTNTNLICYLDAQRSFVNIKHPDFVQEISYYADEIKFISTGALSSPQNGSIVSVPETKSNFYLDGNAKRSGMKGNNKLNKSTENLSSNKITNTWGIKKLFGSKKTITDTVREDSVIQDQSVILHKLVRSYMKVINTAIVDMTPKYIVLNLIQGTMSYIKFQLQANIFDKRETNEDKLELLEIEEGEQNKIDELVKRETSVRKAIELMKNMPINM